MALGTAVTLWSRCGQASAGWDPGRGSCGPGRGSPGRPQFLPPGTSGPGQGSSLPTVAPGHVARWEPLTTARQGGECQGSSCYCAQRSGLHGLGCLMGQLRSHVSQTHFCGHQLGPACRPEECPGPHAGLQAVLTLMSACASGLFLPAQVPLDLAVPTPILPSPSLTPRGGNEASLIESLPQPPRESPSTKHVRTGPPSPRAKKPLPQTLNAPPPDPSPLTPVDSLAGFVPINNPKNKAQGRGPNRASSSAQKSEDADCLNTHEIRAGMQAGNDPLWAPVGHHAPTVTPQHWLPQSGQTNSISRHTVTITCWDSPPSDLTLNPGQGRGAQKPSETASFWRRGLGFPKTGGSGAGQRDEAGGQVTAGPCLGGCGVDSRLGPVRAPPRPSPCGCPQEPPMGTPAASGRGWAGPQLAPGTGR